MKILTAAALSAVLFTAGSTLAAVDATTVDMTELTCKQFSAYDKDNAGTIMMWLEGYYTEEDDDAVIDFGKMASHLTKLLIACQADPSKKVLDLADDAMSD